MKKNKTKQELESDYPLIPMSEISDEARELAVLWSENMIDDFITQKHKLASDIMNYARRYHAGEMSSIQIIPAADDSYCRNCVSQNTELCKTCAGRATAVVTIDQNINSINSITYSR